VPNKKKISVLPCDETLRTYPQHEREAQPKSLVLDALWLRGHWHSKNAIRVSKAGRKHRVHREKRMAVEEQRLLPVLSVRI
jgi:hypothetical protein